MLREQLIDRAREEQRQRRALFMFVVVALLVVGLCGFIGLSMLIPETRAYPVGQVADYADGKLRRFEVPKLSISSFITRRDSVSSEDVVFVRRESDGSWIGLLGVDTVSGCFLYWDGDQGLFRDINCMGARYTPDGRYVDGLITGEQPQNMARLAVEVREGQVFLLDQLVR